MSEYAELNIKSLTLCSFRNYLNDGIVGLFFNKNDLIICPNCKVDDEDEDSGEYTKYLYKTTVLRARERLDAQGYGIRNFESLFNDNALQAIDYSDFLNYLRVDVDDWEKKTKERISKYVSFAKWKNSMKKIVEYELENGNVRWNGSIAEIGISTECDKIIYYSLKDDDCDSYYGIIPEIIDVGYVYRLILEYCNLDDEIILDFSYLDYWASDCIPKALEATEHIEKTIVLVEGTSDKDILEFSIKRMFPHISDLFYFMEFDDSNGGKRDGGTSYVMKNLKTFYFSKIKSRFIAVFDNDAEGYQSKCHLLDEIKNWPENFRILLYPDNTLFRSYPTLAPNGSIVADDINRKACSIELYLPDRIIMSQGKYYPIEWEARKKVKFDGKEESLYQGVISQKDVIKLKFHELRKQIEKGEQTFYIDDWERMMGLLKSIIFAYV